MYSGNMFMGKNSALQTNSETEYSTLKGSFGFGHSHSNKSKYIFYVNDLSRFLNFNDSHGNGNAYLSSCKTCSFIEGIGQLATVFITCAKLERVFPPISYHLFFSFRASPRALPVFFT